MTMYAAAKKYNIAFPTLWKWCKRADVDVGARSSGRPWYLGSHLENKLKSWILEAIQTGTRIY